MVQTLTPYQQWQLERYGDVLNPEPDYEPEQPDMSQLQQDLITIENEQL